MRRFSCSLLTLFEIMHLSKLHSFWRIIKTYGPFSYFEVIKDPMDLSTMAAKLEEGMYKDRFAFQADFQLMIANAKTYNMPESFVHSESVALETAFEKRMLVFLLSYPCTQRYGL